MTNPNINVPLDMLEAGYDISSVIHVIKGNEATFFNLAVELGYLCAADTMINAGLVSLQLIRSSLKTAVSKSNVAMFQHLILNGAVCDAANLLPVAVSQSTPDMVKTVLKYVEDYDDVASNLASAIRHYSGNDSVIIEWLRKEQIYVNCGAQIIVAVREGEMKLLTALLECKNVLCTDRDYVDAIDWAVFRHRPEAFTFLLEHSKVSRETAKMMAVPTPIDLYAGGFDILARAVKHRSEEIVNMLLQDPRINVNYARNNDLSAAQAAAEIKQPWVMLIIKHPSVDAKARKDLLARAVKSNNTPVIEYLTLLVQVPVQHTPITHEDMVDLEKLKTLIPGPMATAVYTLYNELAAKLAAVGSALGE